MKTYTMELQYCLECRKMLRGRSDKKFCDQKCKNNHYNEFRRTRQPAQFRQINQILMQNRNILKELFDRSVEKLFSTEDISNQGFMLSYFTHSNRNQDEQSYYCYDYGLRTAEEGRYQLIRVNEKTPLF